MFLKDSPNKLFFEAESNPVKSTKLFITEEEFAWIIKYFMVNGKEQMLYLLLLFPIFVGLYKDTVITLT